MPDDALPLEPPKTRRAHHPAALTLSWGCAVGGALILVGALAFMIGTSYTINQLTGPAIRSSALVKGFFANLTEGRTNAIKERYVRDHVTVSAVAYLEPEGFLIFGKPARLAGRIKNDGDEVLESVALSIYFVDPSGRIVGGGDWFLPELIKPGESVGFEFSEKDAGFEFPRDAKTLSRVYRVKDLDFYEGPGS